MVAIARDVGRKRAMALALTGDVIDAATALDWGLVNRVVPADQLDAAVADLMGRATRGSRASKAWGRSAVYAQLGRPERDAYDVAVEVVAAASQLDGAREGMTAFLEKRPPVRPDQARTPVLPPLAAGPRTGPGSCPPGAGRGGVG